MEMRPGTGRRHSHNSPQTSPNRKEPSSRRLSNPNRQRPITFFFRTEEEMEEDLKTPQPRESMFGVQSLEEAIDQADTNHNAKHDTIHYTEGVEESVNSLSESHVSVESASQIPLTPELVPHTTFTHGSSHISSMEPLPRQVSSATLSLPLTPVFLQSPWSDSVAPSSPRSACSLKSFRLSDEESVAGDTNSQAAVGEEENEQTPVDPAQHFPQLVMPSISMPSRRAFTEKGKNIGKLRIMVAGAHGVGKTSLIRSIVQTCEDIVHVDPIPSASSASNIAHPHASRRASRATMLQQHASQITEISASTRAYPTWWTEMDESRILRRRRSFGEVVLERNISFVDTPGFTVETNVRSAQEGQLAIQHVENLLQRNALLGTLSDGEVLSILSGSGGVQVDLVFYIFSNELKPDEYELLRHLCQLTNVIPVIGKVDLLSKDEIATLKEKVASSFNAANIRPFSFHEPMQDGNFNQRTVPYAVSSALSNDDDNMDASVLMSPDYVQPLVESDLLYLVDKVFDPEGAAWLRHSATRKFLHWRRIVSTSQTISATSAPLFSASTTTSSLSALKLSTASMLSAPSPSQILASRPSHPFDTSSGLPSPSGSPYTLARLTDHTQREERLAQVHLARWAADLQRSLANERARYTTLQQNERAHWLHERLEECEDVSTANAGALVRHRHRDGGSEKSWPKVLDRRDPLGLLEWDDRMRERAVTLAKVLGGAGVVGAVAVWVLRASGAGVGGPNGVGGGVWGWWSGVSE